MVERSSKPSFDAADKPKVIHFLLCQHFNTCKADVM